MQHPTDFGSVNRRTGVTVTGTDRRRFDVRRSEGLGQFYVAVFDEVYAYAFKLTGGDRVVAEDLVSDGFTRLLTEVDAGRLHEVGAGWLIVAARRRYIDAVDSLVARAKRSVIELTKKENHRD